MPDREANGQAASESAAIEAGALRLVLKRVAAGLCVHSLRLGEQEVLAEKPLPLFSLVLREVRTEREATLSAESGWRQVVLGRTQGCGPTPCGVELRWACPADKELGEFEVVVRAVPGDDAIRWSLRVENRSPAWSLWRVAFPQVALRELAQDGCVLVPAGPGEVHRGLWRREFRYKNLYPTGWCCAMQFVAAYAPEGAGFYFAAHDPVASVKEIVVESQPAERALTLGFEHPVPDMGLPRNEFVLSGEAVWRAFRGDWFDAATLYRDWVRRAAVWFPGNRPAGETRLPTGRKLRRGEPLRADTPQWMRELPVWALSSGTRDEVVPAVKAFACFMGVPVGVHWYNWHQIPFDNDYPHYFPTKPGFAEGVRELQEAGVFVMPYINGRLWDTRDRGTEDFQFTRIALPAAAKDEKGNPYTETYGSKEADGSPVKLAVMCPTTQLWQDKVRELVLRLVDECGVMGVYIDQIAAARPCLCFDPSHGHPLGGGSWWNSGYWKLLDAIQAALPEGRMITTECNSEPYVRWFDGYLTWHWQNDGQVPAFPAVYGGAIQLFGRSYGGGETKALALRMKAGQQLVFGEQIGWIDPKIIEEKESAEFLRRLVRLRWHFRRYFAEGEMARPPRLAGAVPKIEADWQWFGEHRVTTDAVLAGAWRLPEEGKVLFLFVNASDEALGPALAIEPAEYGLDGRAVRIVARNGESSPALLTPAEPLSRREVELPARSALTLEIETQS